MTLPISVDIDELSDRAILVRLYANTISLGDKMSAINDSVANTRVAFDQLKIDIAQELQQVADGLAAIAGTEAAVTQLNAINAELTEQSIALQADNPPA